MTCYGDEQFSAFRAKISFSHAATFNSELSNLRLRLKI
jgi:hypothetical protein